MPLAAVRPRRRRPRSSSDARCRLEVVGAGAPRRARSSATVWPPNSVPADDRRYDGSSLGVVVLLVARPPRSSIDPASSTGSGAICSASDVVAPDADRAGSGPELGGTGRPHRAWRRGVRRGVGVARRVGASAALGGPRRRRGAQRRRRRRRRRRSLARTVVGGEFVTSASSAASSTSVSSVVGLLGIGVDDAVRRSARLGFVGRPTAGRLRLGSVAGSGPARSSAIAWISLGRG